MPKFSSMIWAAAPVTAAKKQGIDVREIAKLLGLLSAD
jgi:hypothetical protein